MFTEHTETLKHNSIFAITAATSVAIAGLAVMPAITHADHTVNPDTDNDGYISVAEGAPFYGGIVHSLTTEGDVSANSALALDRFPVADEDGDYDYERTFELSEDVEDITEAHIVIHSEDIDGSGAYDGDKESSIADGVPFEATAPVACGVVEMDGDGRYYVDLDELNSTGVDGRAWIEVADGDVTVDMEVEGATPELAHAQHIHLGGSNECPPNTEGVDQEDEMNNDKIDFFDRFEERQERFEERFEARKEKFQERFEARQERFEARFEKQRERFNDRFGLGLSFGLNL